MSETGDKKGLYKNAWMLIVLQLANYIFPLLLIPFLSRRLGLDYYGYVAFCLGIVQIANIITDYGFGLSVTYKIAKWKHNKKYVEKLMAAVYVCKFFLVLLMIVVVVIYALFQQNNILQILLIATVLPIVTQAIAPVWLFQGIERMPSFVVWMLISRIFYLIPCFVFVKNTTDGWMVLIALGFANLLAGVSGVCLAKKYGYGVSILPNMGFIWAVFKNSTAFFVSRAAVSIYTTFGVVFLGIFANPVQVSIYSAAEQLSRAVQGLIGMASQALYPYMARTKDYKLLFKLLKVLVALSAVGVGLGYIIGDKVIVGIFGGNFIQSFDVLKVFFWVLFVSIPSVLLGYPLLGALGKLELANKSVIIAGIAQIIFLLSIYFLDVINPISVAVCILLAESLVLIARIYWARKFLSLGK